MLEPTLNRSARYPAKLRPVVAWLISMLLTPAALALFLYASILRSAANPPWALIAFGGGLGLNLALILFQVPVLPKTPSMSQITFYFYRGMGLMITLPIVLLALLAETGAANEQLSSIAVAPILAIALTQWLVKEGSDEDLPGWLIWMEGARIIFLALLVFSALLLSAFLPLLQITIAQ